MVFVYHNRKYWRDSLPTELTRWFNEFHAGVAVFFVLSGFLIAYTYTDEPAHSFKKYLKYTGLRFARIMPVYWLILTAYYLDADYGKNQFSFLTYSLTHGLSNKHNLDGIAQAWSLTVEMSFYMLAPFLFVLLRKKWWWLVAVLISFFLLTWLGGWYWHKVNGNPKEFFYPLQFIATSAFAGRSSEFFAGMLLAFAVKKQQVKWLDSIPQKTAWGFAGIFILLYIVGLFQPDMYSHGYDTIGGLVLSKTILPFFVVILLYGLMSEQTWLSRFLGSKTMVLLGNASFAFYLVHISYVNLKVKEWITMPDRNFILLWLISIALYFLFEKPVYNFCRRILK